MIFYDSFRIIFGIQNIFGLKHYRWNQKENKLSIDRRLLVVSWTLFMLGLLLFLTLIGVISFNFDASIHGSPIDRGLLTTFVLMTTMFSSITSIFITWFFSIWNCHKECRFYQELKLVDEILLKYVELQIIYRRFYKESAIVVGMIAIPNIVGFTMLYVLFGGGLYEVSNCVLFLFLVQYACSSVLCLNLRAIQVRFDLIRTESMKSLTHAQYITLIKATKSLTNLLKLLNDSFALKQGSILCTNFINTTSYLYSMFLAWSMKERTRNRNLFIVSSSKVMIPHLLMMIVSFIVGDFVKSRISLSLYALATSETRSRRVKHMQRRLLLNLKSVTYEVCVLKVVPLNLKVMAKGLNMIAVYFVIILQFKILTDDFFV